LEVKTPRHCLWNIYIITYYGLMIFDDTSHH
jgi:hypothetical protein